MNFANPVTQAITLKTKIPIIISGGISSIKDVIKITEKKSEKIEGVIVGKAIYDESINLKELSRVS